MGSTRSGSRKGCGWSPANCSALVATSLTLLGGCGARGESNISRTEGSQASHDERGETSPDEDAEGSGAAGSDDRMSSVGGSGSSGNPAGSTRYRDAGPVSGAYCGDGEVQEGEECDDGNTSNTDNCTTATTSIVTSATAPAR